RFRTAAANQSAPNFNRKHSPSDFIRCSGLRSYLRRRIAIELRPTFLAGARRHRSWLLHGRLTANGPGPARWPRTLLSLTGEVFLAAGARSLKYPEPFSVPPGPALRSIQEFLDAGYLFSSHRHRSLIRQVGQRGCRAVQT